MPETPEKRMELMARFEEKLAKLEEDHRGHERSVESRIWISRKEERARLAMMDWFEEEIENLETKMERLQTEIDKDKVAADIK